MAVEGEAVWREWTPLSAVLDQLPQQFQRGLSASDLQLTCIAAFPEHLVLGTNVGLVYLAHLPSANLMRLKCEDPVPAVSCVSVVRTVDDMVAAGTAEGTITIFQLPRTGAVLPTGEGRVGSAVLQPTVKRFSVAGLHTARITALAWSLNGMLLFSGDAEGVVCQVEVNYQTSECTARRVLSEATRVVQLSYMHQRLAVSTLQRALVHSLAQGTVHQVGEQPRRHPGPFGCVWSPSAPRKQGLLYTSRPGLRLWSAEGEGRVLQTHIVKDLPERAKAHLLNPSSESPREGERFSFGLLQLVGEGLLVSYNPHWLFLFDVEQCRVLAYSGCFRYITGVATTGQEVFVLEGSRSVSCLSMEPLILGEPRTLHNNISTTPLWTLGNRLVTHGSGLIDQLARVGSTVAAKVTDHTSPAIINGQDLSQKQHWPQEGDGDGALQGHRQGHRRSSSLGQQKDKGDGPSTQAKMIQSFSSLIPGLQSSPTPSRTPPLCHISVIGTPGDYEEVVTSAQIIAQEGAETGPLVTRELTRRRRVLKKGDPAASPSPDTLSINSGKSQSGTSDTATPPTTASPPYGTPGQDSGVGESSFSDIKLDLDAPDTSTLEDLKSDIQQKESLLAEILDLNCLRNDHEGEELGEDLSNAGLEDPLRTVEREHSLEGTECSTPSTVKELSPAPEASCTSGDFYARYYQCPYSFSSLESTTDVPETITKEKNLTGTPREDQEEEEEEDTERVHSNLSEDRSSCLSYGPPSGSSLPSFPSQGVPMGGDLVMVTNTSEVADISWSYPNTQEGQGCCGEEVLCGGWAKYPLPGHAVSLAVSESTLALVDSNGSLYLAEGSNRGTWRRLKLPRKALHVSLAPSGGLAWVECGGTAYAIHLTPTLDTLPASRMVPVARGISCMSVGEEVTWCVDHQHQVSVQASMGEAVPTLVPVGDVQLVRVVSRGQVVWGLTREGQLVFRIGLGGGGNQAGQEWGIMATPEGTVVGVALGPGQRGWIVDAWGGVHFREGVCADFPQGADLNWWQVVTSDYMVERERGKGAGAVLLASSSCGLWLVEQDSNVCYHHIASAVGHRWEVFSEEVWSLMCAEGLYTDQGALCCLSPLGQLFLTNPNTSSCVPLDLPKKECAVVSVSQRPEVLWVLTSAGEVFIRAGLSASSLLGSHWEQLDLSQIGDIHLCHISCGMEVVWGVDTRGGVYMREGPLTPCLSDSLLPAWIQVESTPLKGNAVFTKVFVGLRMHLVWAVDSCKRVYVRQAIYPDLPYGLSWVLVPGLLALHLSISEDRVFALTLGGEVFERVGVSANNFIGDVWEKIPGTLAKVSVTTDNKLWGLNLSGHLCHHHTKEVTETASPDTLHKRLHSLSVCSETSDWEML